MPKPLASIMGPIHDLPFAIQCHHATLYWLAQAEFEAPSVTVRSGQPYDVLVTGVSSLFWQRRRVRGDTALRRKQAGSE
jgi:hypothetical protein